MSNPFAASLERVKAKQNEGFILAAFCAHEFLRRGLDAAPADAVRRGVWTMYGHENDEQRLLDVVKGLTATAAMAALRATWKPLLAAMMSNK